MADTLFLVEETAPGVYGLPPAEWNHAVKVLRVRQGDVLECTDGAGQLFKGRFHASGEIVREEEMMHPGLPLPLHLYVSPTRQPDRLEWMLEKSVELGLGHFSPLLCERTQAFRLKADRLQSIALAAMKQSKRAYLPRIYPAIPLQQALSSATKDAMFMATCAGEIQKLKPTQAWKTLPFLHVFIGPEGDFTPAEIHMAQDIGAIFLDLGQARLRTETAGLSVVHLLHHLHAFL
jgi:16S rRNA (uracil1498-N3)-methyltransferase